MEDYKKLLDSKFKGGVNYLTGTKEYKVNRIRKVCYAILEGYTISQIYDMYAEEWGIKMRSIEEYTRVAKKILSSEVLLEEGEIRKDLLMRYGYLFQLNMQKQDYVEARRVLDSVSRVTQTFNFDLTSKGNNINTIEIIEYKDRDNEASA